MDVAGFALIGAKLGLSMISKIDSTKNASRTVDHMEFNNTFKDGNLVK